MILTNYHGHCHFCDGKGSPDEMLERARELGFKAIGFSSHAPVPFTNDFCMQPEDAADYRAAIRALKAQSQDVEVYLGLEIDFIEGAMEPRDSQWDAWQLDYKIGSVHAMSLPDAQGRWLAVDGPQQEMTLLLDGVYGSDIRALVADYYRCVGELCRQGGFDILGHFDLVKKHNREMQLFDETADWYRELAYAALDEVAKAGVIMELNYGGMLRGATDEIYPPLWILERAHSLGVPIQINADAHAPKHLAVHHQYCFDLAKRAGYTHQRVLLQGRWQDIPLD